MAFESFPNLLYCKVMETAEVVLAGGCTLADDQELAHVVMALYKLGAAAGSERLRLKIYHDAALTNLYATGDWATVATAVDGATNWLGRVRFDFATRVNLDAGQEYFVAVEADGYTRIGETFYLAFPLDWPLSINVSAGPYGHAMELYGRRGVRYL